MDGSGSAAQTEESLRVLGELLGLESTRPDNEYGTGPDVFWRLNNEICLCIEVKTDKAETSQYQKKEVGQLGDHVQWVKDQSVTGNICPIFVGPVRPATNTANPPPEFLVVGLDQFQELGQRVSAALLDIAKQALPISLRQIAFEVFSQRCLMWPKCFEALKVIVLRDLEG